MLLYHFTIDAPPPKGTAQQKGAMIVGKRVHFYTTKKVRALNDFWLNALKPFRATIPPPVLDGAIAVKVSLFYPFPKSAPRKSTELELPHIVRPDVDNVIKAMLDAFTALEFWHDDAQVYWLDIAKYRSRYPRIEVTLKQYDEYQL